ncbi:DNA primase [Pontibacter ummariensis]|uniref:DNA primase n=1 Tax=Pontibacter ummariensis TaxID=1610492 RepID=A0A239L8D4_9BACT|nr:DNA primase [Pontibacter ummariensis]PRY03991.1 DNA primase [Pontibacter ummariensis]SNT26585.1 DNA primase [Pontibacter ummariensis]
MSLIPKETVDQVLALADITEVVGDFVSLKKKGQNMWACCPFHHEKSPSFSVSPAKGIYKCFGCGKAGNSVQFIMDIEGTSFPEAIKFLAKKYHIDIPEDEPNPEYAKEQSERDSLFIVSDFASKHYQQLLHNHEQGGIGQSYLKQRGLSNNTIRKFELGYSLDEWTNLTDAALKAGYQQKYLEATGLTIAKEDGKKYDRFRGRVMFPIHNVSGRVVGFGARTLKSNDKKSPKYLNSPESDIYHKSNVLYGLFQAKQAIRMQDMCYMVEGYLDVLSLHQGGIENVVASSGTSLTEGQIKLIARYTQNITVLYDGDAAGIKASLRGIDLILESGLNVDVVTFPEGEDPDSYIQKVGDTNFKNYIKEKAQDFISFKTSLYAEEAKGNPVKKAEAIREIVASIAKIPDSIKRTVFFRSCSLIFDIDEQVLISEYNKMQLQDRQPSQKPGSSPFEAPVGLPVEEEPEKPVSDVDVLKRYEREIVRMLLNYPNQMLEEGVTTCQYMLEQLEDVEFRTPLYARLMELVKEKLCDNVIPSAEDFVHYPDQEIRTEATHLLSDPHELSHNWETHQIFVPKETDLLPYGAERAVLRLKWRNVELILKGEMEKLRLVTDPQEQDNQLNNILMLKQLHSQLGDMLGIVVNR